MVMTRIILSLALVLAAASPVFAQTIRPPYVEISPEEYQRILADAARLSQNLEGFIAEMLIYKHDTDGQLGDQFSRLDAAKKALDAIVEVNNTQNGWIVQFQNNDKGHDSKIAGLQGKDGEHDTRLGQLATQANSLDSAIKALQAVAASLSATLTSSNTQQNQRLDAVEGKNRDQDAAAQTLAGKVADLQSAVTALAGQMTSANNTLADFMTKTAARLKALEDANAPPSTPSPPPSQETAPTP
jgi:chromosome segregation ATPase